MYTKTTPSSSSNRDSRLWFCVFSLSLSKVYNPRELVTVTTGVRFYHILCSDWLIDTRPYSDWLVVYETGKILHPIKMPPPRDERGISIDR